ncbi:MAG: hypothetical protein ACTSYU_10685 [Promethearchaeota archaeon]
MVFTQSVKHTTKTSPDTDIIPIRLDKFPGIGQISKKKLLQYYTTEERALNALQQGLIGCAPGFTFKQALRFSQTYFEMTEGISNSDVIRTSDMMDIYAQIQKLIMQYTKTEYSNQKLQFYGPLPSSKIPLIMERQAYFQRALDFYNKYEKLLESHRFISLLKNLNAFHPLDTFPKIKSRIYITDSAKIFSNLHTYEFSQSIAIEQIKLENDRETYRLFQHYAKNFDVVLYIGTITNKIPDFPNLLSISPKDISSETIIPEQIIRLFGYNKDLIQNLIKIVVAIKNTKEKELIHNFLPIFDLQKLKKIKENASILDNSGNIRDGVDLDLDCYQQDHSQFTSIISEIEGQINKDIQKEIGDRSIEIQGKQILNLFRTDMTIESIRSYIPAEVDELINEIIQKYLEKLRKDLHLPSSMEDTFAKLIPEIIEYPFQLVDDGVDILAKTVSARFATHKYSMMVKIAHELAQTYQYLLELHQTLLEFEFFYAIGHFAHDFHLQIPHLSPSGKGFSGTSIHNLFLQNASLNSSPMKKTSASIEASESISETSVPIRYALGSVQKSVSSDLFPQTHTQTQAQSQIRLALLTGSNSGGKTMCLLTSAQCILLAQMGFPTSGNFHFYPFDELYYFKKSSGQISAGAFETTLLHFVEMAQSNANKIILADELEAITEPNAAAKVLTGIFSLILQNPNNYGIFVTHLVEMMMPEIDSSIKKLVRIDGIEAKGLDANLNLIVDRNPKYNYVANSTPELIIKRLAQSGSTNQQRFFTHILRKFEKI